MNKIDNSCPHCGSFNVLWLFKEDNYFCEDCHEYFVSRTGALNEFEEN